MRLYHFTRADLAVIKIEGLKPGSTSWHGLQEVLGPSVTKKNVVWLTPDPHLIFTVKRLPTHRLTVEVPKMDRRLVPFAEILRQLGVTAQRLGMDDKAMKSFEASYVFLGSIPPNRITAVGKVEYHYTPGYLPPTGLTVSAVE